ncbi:hypothetical protein CRM90_05240 [Mycobacterium sp. ENV421]|nr:hypothetical protein CRM90_05240 [Mycobacterium sp. ENV421]
MRIEAPVAGALAGRVRFAHAITVTLSPRVGGVVEISNNFDDNLHARRCEPTELTTRIDREHFNR